MSPRCDGCGSTSGEISRDSRGVYLCHGCFEAVPSSESNSPRISRAQSPSTALSDSRSKAPRPGPSPGPGTNDQERPLVRELLELHEAGQIGPDFVHLGPFLPSASTQMRAIAEDIRLRLGLLLAEGITRALPYAASEAVAAGHVVTKGGASYALKRLAAEGVIRYLCEMPKVPGKGNGTKLYVPPGWRPVEPEVLAVAIETGDRERVADLVWVPDEPAYGPGSIPVEPSFEGVNEMLMDGQHGWEPTGWGGRS